MKKKEDLEDRLRRRKEENNTYSSTLIKSEELPAYRAMLYATGIKAKDLYNPQIGVVSGMRVTHVICILIFYLKKQKNQ